MALTLITPRWEGQSWFGTLMGLCFEYAELPAEPSTFTPLSPDLWLTDHPPVWTMMVFRFERGHAWG